MKKVTLDTGSLSLLSAPFIWQDLDFQYFIKISVYRTVFAFIIAIFQNSGFSKVRLSKLVTYFITLTLVSFNVKPICKIIQIMENSY